MSLNNLSIDLANAGRRDEGLTAIQDAVEIRRQLTACDEDRNRILNGPTPG